MRYVGVVAPAPGPIRMAIFGAIMGLLPCMIMFWVLGIAISSSDPLQGALMMLTLVAMTTPMMLAVAASVGWVSHRFRHHLSAMVPGMMSVSALWMVMVALAANGLIEHQSATFSLFETTYIIMFW
jgi:sulfite exporter TauE/SafE